MKLIYFMIILLNMPIIIFCQQFDTTIENISKEEVIEILGNPDKKITSNNEKADFFIWFDKKNMWIVFFQDNKARSNAIKIEDFLQQILEFSTLFSEPVITNGEQQDNNKELLSTNNKDTEQSKFLLEVKNKIEIDIIESTIIETWDNEKKAGRRFKIKNNSSETIYNLDITVYYFDKNGKIFFEETFYPVNSSSWTDKNILKPNYSILYPAGKNKYMTASNMDITEWDEGKIKVEIKEIDIQEPDE